MNLELDKRDQIIIFIGAMAVLLVVLMGLYIPAGPKKHYEQSVQQLESLKSELQLQQMLKLEETERVQSQQALLKRLQARPASFNFFAFVKTLLDQSGLTDRFALERYDKRGVSEKQPLLKLDLTGVSLDELIDFLHRMYKSENLVSMYRMDLLRPAKNNKGLDCELVLITIE